MSEQPAVDAAQNEPPKPTPPAQAADAEESKADEVDWKAKAREWERRAKDNKTAADELAAIKEAQKSDAEKASERLSESEKRAETAESALLRYKVAARHGISESDAELFLTGADEETLTAQAQRLAGIESERARQGNVVPGEGTSAPAAALNGDGLEQALKSKLGIV